MVAPGVPVVLPAVLAYNRLLLRFLHENIERNGSKIGSRSRAEK